MPCETCLDRSSSRHDEPRIGPVNIVHTVEVPVEISFYGSHTFMTRVLIREHS